jgi:hypothetical protein
MDHLLHVVLGTASRPCRGYMMLGARLTSRGDRSGDGDQCLLLEGHGLLSFPGVIDDL